MIVRYPHPAYQAPEPGGGGSPSSAPAAGGGGAASPPAPGAGDPSAAAAAAAPAAPEGPLAAYWNAETKSFDTEKLASAFTERDAAFLAAQERAKGVPAKPEEYKLALPEDFKAPEGMQITFDEKNPVLAEARTIAHELGIPQAGLSKLLALQAKATISAAQAGLAEHQAMVAAEVQKMGGEETYKARIAPLDTWIGANFAADEQAEIRLLRSTEAGVRVIEKLMKAANGTSMPPRVGDAPPPKPADQPMENRWYGNDTNRKAS